MALTIRGSARSRAMRVLWMAEELGLEYLHDPITFDDPRLKSPEFLKINPAGAIPVVEDMNLALSESLAITLYLAKRHALGRLYPASLEDEALVWRWTLWAQGELEPWVCRETRETATAQATADLVRPAIDAALTTLERALSDRRWLVGSAFSVADFNVAAVLSPSRTAHLDLVPYPNVTTWLARCYSRPAAIAARERFS